MSDYFSNEVDKYFAHWILSSTWQSDGDESRFFQFVKALDYYEYSTRLDESQLERKILAAVQRNHGSPNDAIRQRVEKLVRTARKILDFMNTTRDFPIDKVDAWSPPLR